MQLAEACLLDNSFESKDLHTHTQVPYTLVTHFRRQIVGTRAVSHIGTATAEYEAKHGPHGQPLRNSLDEYAAGESHKFREGRSLVVYAVQLGLLERRASVDDLGRHGGAISRSGVRFSRFSQGLASSGHRAARHRVRGRG